MGDLESDDDDEDDFERDADDNNAGFGGRNLGKLLHDEDLSDDSDDSADEGEAGTNNPSPPQTAPEDPLFSIDLRKVMTDYLVASASSAAGFPELANRMSLAVTDAKTNPS